jgi:Protein of unknown function (DUF3072)
MAHNEDEDRGTRDESVQDSGAPEPGHDPDKPMTDTQRTYLEPLAESQDAKVKDDMSEDEASRTIDRLQENAVHVY